MANLWQQFGNTIFWGNGPRKIGNVLNGTADSDAVNLGQVNSLIAGDVESSSLTTEEVSTNYVRIKDALGTPAEGVSVSEFGDGKDITAVITLADVSLGEVAAAAAEVIGAEIYEYPSGAIVQHYSHLNVSLTATTQTADTPDIGLGTDNADGDAVATLNLADGGSGDAENVLTGQTAADCNGTATVKTTATPLVIESADGHSLYLNVAATWSGADEGVTANGTIVIKYTIMS